MHPSTSSLIRNTLYLALKDARDIFKYPDVVGMRKRLYWFDHKESEAERRPNRDTTSYYNLFEVEMVTHLVNHLAKQNCYKPDELAVLTPLSYAVAASTHQPWKAPWDRPE